MLREYETLYHAKPDATEERLAKLQERVTKVVKASEGTLFGFDDWGTRKLAYDIAKNQRAHTILIGFAGPGKVVAEVERELRLDDVVLRYMTQRLGDDVDPESKKKEFLARIAKARRSESEDESSERVDKRPSVDLQDETDEDEE